LSKTFNYTDALKKSKAKVQKPAEEIKESENLEKLKMRLAKGEISKEEYEELKKTIEK